ncbi:MAG: FtsW/RodA/SpoVE family cell cycle protein, partial [Kordiimonadaceae bacterium]|nr:FtsW/RodA/SpoVE family cell cycle protein [Kordiimonadaceae bacterium]
MANVRIFGPRRVDKTPLQRLYSLNWGIVLAIVLIGGVGVLMLYSVAGGQWEPWASRHAIRLGIALVIMLAIAVTDISYWMAFAYPAWALGLLLLLLVEFTGSVGMGGQRWLDIGIMRLQPSELMKIGVVMALARYYHARTFEQSRRFFSIIIPLVLIFLPAFLVVRQPDFGTGLMVVMGGVSVLFLAGLPAWLFAGAAVSIAAAIPIVWELMKDYQRGRVLTFLNP